MAVKGLSDILNDLMLYGKIKINEKLHKPWNYSEFVFLFFQKNILKTLFINPKFSCSLQSSSISFCHTTISNILNIHVTTLGIKLVLNRSEMRLASPYLS